MLNRRRLLQQLGLIGGGFFLGGQGAVRSARGETLIDKIGAPLRPWEAGTTDIHFIATGRGDSTLIILPDGTSMLIDAGAVLAPAGLTHADPQPDGSRRPGEWIGRYVARQLASTKDIYLDYALVTHFHEDHLGAVPKERPKAANGFIPTGISDVAALVPVHMLIDRSFPDYDLPLSQSNSAYANYRDFVAQRVAKGENVEKFRVGANDQILPRRRPNEAGIVEIRNIAANGLVWSGEGSSSRTVIRQDSSSPGPIDENSCSLAIRLRHGAFGFYAAGDLSANDFDGTAPNRALGNAAAIAAGRVTLAAAPHHGMFDGVSGQVARALRPRLWLLSTWHATHPNMETLERLYNTKLYDGPRDVIATALTPANAAANGRLTDRFLSSNGHVVVRVAQDGESFYVAITDNGNEHDRVKNIFGPWLSTS